MGKRSIAIIAITIAISFFIFGCSIIPTGQLIKEPQKQIEEHYDKFISALELQKIVNNKEVKIIDIRVSWQYNEGHIPNSLNIPLGELDVLRINAEGISERSRIIVYDGSGKQSIIAYEVLTTKGYKKTQILEGGFDSWVANELVVKQSY